MIIRRFLWDRGGAAAVEFSLTSPIFIALLLCIAQLGLWLLSDFALQNGAVAAARYGAVAYGANCASSANVLDVQTRGAQNVIAISVAPAAFAVTQSGCGCQVAATYAPPNFTTLLGTPPIQVSALACFPT